LPHRETRLCHKNHIGETTELITPALPMR
jgi:hypothetical protein